MPPADDSARNLAGFLWLLVPLGSFAVFRDGPGMTIAARSGVISEHWPRRDVTRRDYVGVTERTTGLS